MHQKHKNGLTEGSKLDISVKFQADALLLLYNQTGALQDSKSRTHHFTQGLSA